MLHVGGRGSDERYTRSGGRRGSCASPATCTVGRVTAAGDGRRALGVGGAQPQCASGGEGWLGHHAPSGRHQEALPPMRAFSLCTQVDPDPATRRTAVVLPPISGP